MESENVRHCGFRSGKRAYFTPARALPQMRLELVELALGSIGVYFHIAVVEIPRPSGDASAARGVLSKSPVSHALHSARDHEAPGLLSLHCRRF